MHIKKFVQCGKKIKSLKISHLNNYQPHITYFIYPLCLCTFYKHTHTIIHTNDYIHPSANGTENLCCFLLWAFFINPFISSHIFCSHSLISNRYPILYICYGSLSFVFNNNVIIYKLYIFKNYLFYKHRISIIYIVLFYHALSCFFGGEDLKINYRNHSFQLA